MDEYDLAAALGVEPEELPNYLNSLKWYVAKRVAQRGLPGVVIDEVVSEVIFRVLIHCRVRRPDQTAGQFRWSMVKSIISHVRGQLTIAGRTDEAGKVQRVYRLQSIEAGLDQLEDFNSSESPQETMEFNEFCKEIRKELRKDAEANAIFELRLQGVKKPRQIAAELGISVTKIYTVKKRLERKVNKVLERLGKCSIKTRN